VTRACALFGAAPQVEDTGALAGALRKRIEGSVRSSKVDEADSTVPLAPLRVGDPPRALSHSATLQPVARTARNSTSRPTPMALRIWRAVTLPVRIHHSL